MKNRIVLILLVAMLVAHIARLLPTETALAQGGSFAVLSPEYVRVGDNIYHLDFLNPPIGWRLLPYLDFTLPPVPASSIVALSDRRAITDTGEGWMLRNGWESAGQIPGVVGVQRSSWGAVKARYR